MAKKHCEKHANYVYNCDECRLANNELVKGKAKATKKKSSAKKTTKTKKTTKKTEKPQIEEPVKMEIEDSDEFEEEEEDRFSYRKPPSRRKRISIIAGVLVAAIIILIISLYVIPKWLGKISLNSQLYALKTDVTSTYWEFFVLDYWSTGFIINKTGLIGALIGCVVFTLPPEHKIFTVITQRLGWKKLKLWKTILIWWTVGFVVFYFIGQLIDLFSQFSLVIYMAKHSGLDISIGNAFSSFIVLKNPADLDIVSVFVYSNLYRPIINYILILIVFRIILSIVSSIFIDLDYYNIAAKASFIIAILFTMNFFSIPGKNFNGLKLILVWTTPLAMIGFTILGVLLLLYPRFRENVDRFTQTDKKRTIIAGISLVVLLLIPAFISIPTSVKINNDQSVWEEEKWNTQLAVEREWTIQAAGLNIFNDTEDIRNLNESSGNIAKSIRQYDKEAALYQMNSYAQTTFEDLADSDIVNVGGKEYWVAPKTLKYDDFIAGDNIKEHTNLFDHVEGFLAIDPYTGALISNETEFFSIFGVNNSYPIFFGEHELDSNSSKGSFDDDILLNTDWTNSAENYNYTYEGEMDGSLSGLSAFWFTLEMGLTSYAFDRDFPKEFIINRNIKERVANILLPGLEIDEDPYLVFDYTTNTMYYALSIYTNIRIGSYAQSPLLRYIGTVLLDVKLGTLDFVKNPQLDSIKLDDPTYAIWKLYESAYPWESVNSTKYSSWLVEQLRYPEQLFELQLHYEYTYHVDDPNTWRGGSQFYARPPSGDLFYVRFDLGDGLEFVGVDLVQRQGLEANILAGMYVLRHGVHFGEVRFYSGIEIGQSNMIGPNTAQQSLIAAATQELVLIDKEDYGNVLLYPLGTSLYYFVPVYSTSNDERFQVLKIAGFVNAFNALDVVYGETAQEAYELLNLSITEELVSGNISLTYEMDDTTLENDILLDIYIKSDDLNFTFPATPKNVQVNISIESDIIDIFRPGVEYLENSTFLWGSGETGMNYTILDESLDPLEGFSTTVRLSGNLGSVYSITIRFKVVLIVDGIVYEPDFYEFVTFYK